jgi:hypothetical protein
LVNKIKSKGQSIRIADLDTAIRMLTTYIESSEINPLVSALETLKTETENEDYQVAVTNAFNGLAGLQGAALTYAPYLSIFVSDDPFADY